jgi:DNA polymerase III delta subunit
MYYLIYGENYKKRKAKRDSLVEAFKKKRPGAEVFEIETENFEEDKLDELLFSQGLFEKKYIVIGKKFFGTKETQDVFLKKLPEIAKSPNVFLFLEDGLLKTLLKKIETQTPV